jgi:hypothetical protein
MTVKDILQAYLKEHGFDGLYNCEIPCGCLAEDLCPCCGDWGFMTDCEPGHRKDYKAADKCGCDGEGKDHWHIEPTGNPLPSIFGFINDAPNWLCECGKRCDLASADWRWNGQQWEHSHGYPIGHVIASREPAGKE